VSYKTSSDAEASMGVGRPVAGSVKLARACVCGLRVGCVVDVLAGGGAGIGEWLLVADAVPAGCATGWLSSPPVDGHCFAAPPPDPLKYGASTLPPPTPPGDRPPFVAFFAPPARWVSLNTA